jgi:glycosyltransferase involved in cell wall biosynthesis
MRILVVTDAWFPQINGVVRTLSVLGEELVGLGHTVAFVTPDRFRSLPCPTYPEIRLALFPGRGVARSFAEFRPDAVHIATEGPLGWAARRFCITRGLPFTTAFHTRFPEYVHARTRVPTAWSYALLRRFHGAGAGMMVATESMRRQLAARGFRNLRRWTRGVDARLFHPGPDPAPAFDLPRPVFLYVGRVAVEKNIQAFLDADLPGSKLVVGDGPMRPALAARYPGAVFAGARHGEALAACYRAADAFVFPSRTDTFGLVMLEALASGLPVAAFPEPGPLDVIGDSRAGVLGEDLATAARAALAIDRAACRAHALRYSWTACAELFIANLAPFGAGVARAA